MTQCLEHVIREHVFIVKKFATWKNRFLKDSTERVQLTWYLKPKKKKTRKNLQYGDNSDSLPLVTYPANMHKLPQLTNMH